MATIAQLRGEPGYLGPWPLCVPYGASGWGRWRGTGRALAEEMGCPPEGTGEPRRSPSWTGLCLYS